MGVSGSGKSTIGSLLARELGFDFQDGDQFHPAANVEKMHASIPLTDADRRPWLEAIADFIDRYPPGAWTCRRRLLGPETPLPPNPDR